MERLELSNTIQQELCLRCKELDIRHAFLPDDDLIPPTGTPILSLGKRSQKINCPMCQFFRDFSPTYKRNHKLQVRLFDHIKQSVSDPNSSALMKLPRTRFLSVVRENSRLEYNHEIAHEIIQSGLLVYVPQDLSASSPPPVHAINTTTVDFKLLSNLMSHCHTSHSQCSRVEDSRSLPYIYLIDCIEERVVPEHPNQIYLALSYVWGEPQPSSEITLPITYETNWPDGCFSFNTAPLTVQDAVRAVRNLGRRYLWVDKYCINQKEGTEKQMMLQNMDHIYENAEATIVALYGDNDRAGLPGVSRVSRTPQPFFQTVDGRVVSSCPPISTIIQASVWSTRGWTYQEARLSRLCLFFTEHQAYVVCRETTTSEAVPSGSKTNWLCSLLNSSRLDAALFGPQVSLADGFWRDRFAFSRRALTNESDILDAFRGILNQSGFITYWGVPITPPNAAMDANIGFALGFLWTRRPSWDIRSHLRPAAPLPRTRRVGFPTWSWASVNGEIFNEGYGEDSVFGAYLRADTGVSQPCDAYLKFWIFVHGETKTLPEAMQQRQSNILPENSPTILVEGDIVRLTLTDSK